MSEKNRLDRKIGFQNMFYTKCINVIIDNIGPSIILRSIISLLKQRKQPPPCSDVTVIYLHFQCKHLMNL